MGQVNHTGKLLIYLGSEQWIFREHKNIMIAINGYRKGAIGAIYPDGMVSNNWINESYIVSEDEFEIKYTTDLPAPK